MKQRIGCQEPILKVCPKYTESYGYDAVALATSYGLTPDEWQASFIVDAFAHDEFGKPYCTVCGLDVPRQNGKNAIIEVIELFAIAVLGWHVLHTAHEVRTYKKAFNRLRSYFEQPDKYPELYQMVVKPTSRKKALSELSERDLDISKTNGQEAIHLYRENPDTGLVEPWGSIEFSSRTRGAARGFDNIQLIVFDEGQELTDEQLEAIMSTAAASSTGTRMLLYTGTPPKEDSAATVMKNARKKALSGDAENTLWYSWACKEFPGTKCTWDDVEDLVYRCNPGMGVRLQPDFTKAEFSNMSAYGFARERLDWWSEETQTLTRAIPATSWRKCLTDSPPQSESAKIAYGVKYTPDGKNYALAAAVLEKGRKPYIELIDFRSTSAGSTSLAQWIYDRKGIGSLTAIDGRAGADALSQKLEEMSMPRLAYHQVRTNELKAAVSTLVDDIAGSNIEHTEQPVLDDSATKSTKRYIGQGGGFGFGDGPASSAAPIEACALALWAARNTKRNPKRKLRIG